MTSNIQNGIEALATVLSLQFSMEVYGNVFYITAKKESVKGQSKHSRITIVHYDIKEDLC